MSHLHTWEERIYTYECIHCEKKVNTDLVVPPSATEQVVAPWPTGWHYICIFSDVKVILCPDCMEKFRDRLVALRNEIYHWGPR